MNELGFAHAITVYYPVADILTIPIGFGEQRLYPFFWTTMSNGKLTRSVRSGVNPAVSSPSMILRYALHTSILQLFINFLESSVEFFKHPQHVRIEMRGQCSPIPFRDDLVRGRMIESGLIGALISQRVILVRDVHDPSFNGNQLTFMPLGIAAPISSLVM